MSEQATVSLHALHEAAIIPVDKPENWTSFDVVNKLRRVSRVKKVGHAGTLDPFATGLLLICFSKATKQIQTLMELQKEYVCTQTLGKESDTHDRTGTVVKDAAVPEFSDAEIESVLQMYRGEIQQVPPMYSAIKHKGVRLYELARKGQSVERAPRPVTIYELELLARDADSLTLRVVCSRGTYIRALARDIGRDLGCGALVSSLKRTRVGSYSLENAWDLPALVEAIKEQRLSDGSL